MSFVSPMEGLWSRAMLCYDWPMIRSALILLLLAPTLAAAQSAKTVDCYCTDRSHNRVELGETICLQVDGRMFMAQCQMSLNVPMWREVEQGCLSSSLEGGEPPFDTASIDPKI